MTLYAPPAAGTGTTSAASRQPLGAFFFDEYTVQLLDKHLPPTDHRMEIVTLLQSWL